MDILLGLAALVVLISVPALLGLIYLELRQRRMFGSRAIISTDHGSGGSHSHELASIAMSLQTELERLRSDVHGAITAVSTDIERVHERLVNAPAVAPAAVVQSVAEQKVDPQRTAAVVELYSALSKLDVTFLAVARPVLLPGESFDEDTELPLEAYAWDSWNDVGAAAYQFAEVFSERRIYLDPVARDHLNTAVGSIRRCLTQELYPSLTDMDPRLPDENRQAVVRVVSTLASNIQDARAVLEQSAHTG